MGGGGTVTPGGDPDFGLAAAPEVDTSDNPDFGGSTDEEKYALVYDVYSQFIDDSLYMIGSVLQRSYDEETGKFKLVSGYYSTYPDEIKFLEYEIIDEYGNLKCVANAMSLRDYVIWGNIGYDSVNKLFNFNFIVMNADSEVFSMTYTEKKGDFSDLNPDAGKQDWAGFFTLNGVEIKKANTVPR